MQEITHLRAVCSLLAQLHHQITFLQPQAARSRPAATTPQARAQPFAIDLMTEIDELVVQLQHLRWVEGSAELRRFDDCVRQMLQAVEAEVCRNSIATALNVLSGHTVHWRHNRTWTLSLVPAGGL